MSRMQRAGSRVAALIGLVTLAACMGPTGPIYGDWRGRQLGASPSSSALVNLVLYGNPGDRSGQYDFQATITDATLQGTGSRSVIWGDRWTLAPGGALGSPSILQLHNLPSGQISRYALMPNGVLVPVTRAGLPDTSPYSLHYALAPVPSGSRSYGRL